MRFQIGFLEFPGVKSPAAHPVVARKEFSVVATRSDGKKVVVAVTNNGFDLDDPTVTRIEFRFWSVLNLTGKEFTTIKIIQQFSVQAKTEGKLPTFTLLPHVWIFEDLVYPQHQHNRLGTHPLLRYDNQSRTITLNCLIVNLTAFWQEAHKDNPSYKRHDLAWPKGEIRFRVLAHLGGPPFIWYVSAPDHLLFKNNISPHTFFCPADHTESQPIFGTNNVGSFGEKDLEYLKAGVTKSMFKKDGGTLMSYLLPPLADTDVPALKASYLALGESAESYRNAVTTENVTQEFFIRQGTDVDGNRVVSSKRWLGFKDKPQPIHWQLYAGLEKAFVADDPKINQVLLVPQRPAGGNNIFAVSNHLPNVVTGIMHMLWANDEVINQNPSSTGLQVGKYILSCYSESGVDLWEASTNNMDKVKAVIAIEPQNLNKITNTYANQKTRFGGLGSNVMKEMLQRKIQVFFIGRHDTSYYKPNLPKSVLAAVKFKPDEPDKLFQYPPNPDSNDFVRYRVSRLLDIKSDPLMTKGEKTRLIEARKKLKNPDDLYNLIFDHLFPNNSKGPKRDEHNADVSASPADNVIRWYSHQFALSGGQIMQLPSDHLTKGMYGRPVSYRTFFQECVHEIG